MLKLVVRTACVALALALASTDATAQVTKRFKINGMASASSDYAWGFSQAQVNCIVGPPAGSPASAFVTQLVNDINAIAGPGSAFMNPNDVLRIVQPADFDFYISSGCPATHPASQKVTDVGGAPVTFNPTIAEILTPPVPAGGPGLHLALGLGLVAAGLLVLRRRA